MISSALGRQVLARGADQRVEVRADDGRLVGVGVAGAEPAAEVVDRELAERGDRRDRPRERLHVEDLRSRRGRAARACAGAGCARSGGSAPRRRRGASPNFDPSWPVSTCAWVSAATPGSPARARPARGPPGTVASSRSTSSALSTTTSPSPCSTAIATSSSVFALPCSTRSAGSAPALSAVTISPRAGDVEPEPLLDHHPLDRGARERLGGEHDPRPRPARGELARVLARAVAQRALGDDQHGRAELGGELVGAAAAEASIPSASSALPGGNSDNTSMRGEPTSQLDAPER